MFRFALVLLLLGIVPLRANLGESVADCVKRYGKPVGFSERNAKFPFGTLVFEAGPYTLVVFLQVDKEVGARVTKKDKSAFSDTELKTIMVADTLGAGWTTSPSADPSSANWTRVDKATALYDRQNHVLIFMSKEMSAAAHAQSPSTNSVPVAPNPPAGNN